MQEGSMSGILPSYYHHPKQGAGQAVQGFVLTAIVTREVRITWHPLLFRETSQNEEIFKNPVSNLRKKAFMAVEILMKHRCFCKSFPGERLPGSQAQALCTG